MLPRVQKAVSKPELVQQSRAEDVRVSDRQVPAALKCRLPEPRGAQRIPGWIHSRRDRLCVVYIREHESPEKLVARAKRMVHASRELVHIYVAISEPRKIPPQHLLHGMGNLVQVRLCKRHNSSRGNLVVHKWH